jgi:hypothetical protein
MAMVPAVVDAGVVEAGAGSGAADDILVDQGGAQKKQGPAPIQNTINVPSQTSSVSGGVVDDTVMILGVILIIINFTVGGQFAKIIGVVWGGSTTNIVSDLLQFVGEFVFVFILAALARINDQMRGVAIALVLGLGLVLFVSNPGAVGLIGKLTGK